MSNDTPVTGALLHSIPSARTRLGNPGRSMVYELIGAGELEVVKLGARTFITDDSIRRLIERRKVAPKRREKAA